MKTMPFYPAALQIAKWSLAAMLLIYSSLAWAQSGALLTQSDPGMVKNPDGAGAGSGALRTPKDPGSVKVPPPTGTEEMITQPKNVDPGISRSTDKIDRTNRQKSEQKPKKRPKSESSAQPQAQ